MTAEAPSEPGHDKTKDCLSFWEFFSRVFVPEQNIQLPLKPEHKEICDTMQQAFLCTLPLGIEYVVINLAPRVGKTKIAQAFGCWATGEFHDSQFIYTGYSGDIAEESLSYIADVMRTPWFIDLYGDHVHTKKADRVGTIEGGNLYAEGILGSLTGKGGGLKRPAGGAIIIDDAAKPDEALSPVMAEKVQQKFETTLKNRRNSDRYCPIIIIGQRLGDGDLPGYVLSKYPEQTLHIKIKTLKDDGTSAFPETVSAATLEAYKKTRLGRFVLASQYQQDPIALGGNLIPIDQFHRWDPRTPIRFEKRVITCDTAMKIKQWNDHSVLALWGLFQGKAYLIDLMRGKWESPALLENSNAFWKKHTADTSQPRPRFVIEEKAAGTGLIQQLRDPKVGVPAEGIERDIDKVRRVKNILAYIETGMVVVPQDDSVPWIAAFLTEHARFTADGTASEDDQVDTTVDGIELTLGRPTSIFDVLTSHLKR